MKNKELRHFVVVPGYCGTVSMSPNLARKLVEMARVPIVVLGPPDK